MGESMQITLTRSGGQLPIHEVLGPIDTASLPEQDAAKIEALIVDMNFFDLPADDSGPGNDLYYYSTTVVDGDRTHTVSVNTTSDAPYRRQLGELEKLLEATGAAFSKTP